MSRETGLPAASIMRIWHAFGIKPYLEKYVQASAFIEFGRELFLNVEGETDQATGT